MNPDSSYRVGSSLRDPSKILSSIYYKISFFYNNMYCLVLDLWLSTILQTVMKYSNRPTELR